MEEEMRRDDGCCKKRRRSSKKIPPSSSPPPHLDLSTITTIFSSFDRSMFPLLLASASNLQNPDARSLILRFLRSQLALITTTTSFSSMPLPHAFLSLLPLLLTSSYSSVAALTAEVVGATVLHSLEANAMIASDGGVVKGLVWALGSRSRRVAKAACNAVMDLSTSPIGRERLREASAVDKLLYLFCQESLPVPLKLFQDTENADTKSFREASEIDNLLALTLDTAVTLINSSSEDFTDRISTELVKRFSPVIHEIWDKLKGSALLINSSWQKSSLRSTKNDLAETIFRISMNQSHAVALESNEIKISIFGTKESDFENFILNYWEKSPLLLRGVSKNSEMANTIFNSLRHSFNIRTAANIIDSILVGLVSCPPIASDEVDITCFLNEMNDSLGCPIITGQDIRVLRTRQLNHLGSAKGYTEKEEHFFVNGIALSSANPFSLHKCKEAFNDGYSIALRGMEFRFDKVAAIAACFADLFGQPSVGANLYISPPRSQGLARHYDDHCVLVWQLFGKKQWMVSPRPTCLLPRLYEPLDSVSILENNICEGMRILIEEGDILYIPRGYVHEAHTLIDESESEISASADYSIHLTLAIEVELPFEWEGFAHVALHCWKEKQKQASHHSIDSKLKKPSVMFPLLLHVSIKQIADRDPVFRKACLIAGKFLSSDLNMSNHSENLIVSQKSTFRHVIDKINENSNFSEAFKCVELVVQERDDNSLQWMRWLRHLPLEGEDDNIDYCNLFIVLEDLVVSYIDFVEDATVEFIWFKSQFCRCVNFEDTCKSFDMVLEKYRKTRNQYMKGMLSLHRR
ncbi:uncharacterized protein [Typha angustifolia]|uniref:uncharacterized protein isoform X1 n=1 Tax=Typha angustifolia TaxID=59011 RepID=UPI003C2BDBE6